jgi:hypothetical protein
MGNVASVVSKAANALSIACDAEVEERYNSNGKSGGAWLITSERGGFLSNADAGISVSKNLAIHIYMKEEAVFDPTKVEREHWYEGMNRYAWIPCGTIEEAINVIRDNCVFMRPRD